MVIYILILMMVIVVSGYRYLKDLWDIKVLLVQVVVQVLKDIEGSKVHKVIKDTKVFKVLKVIKVDRVLKEFKVQ